MRAHRIRFIAWGFALLLLATLLTRGWQGRPPVVISKPASSAPGLLHVDGPAEPINQPAMGQEALASLRFRDSQSPSEHAIQEPGAANNAAEPSSPHLVSEFEPLPKYDLAESGEASENVGPLPPVELLLAEPKREEAPVAPGPRRRYRVPPKRRCLRARLPRRCR